jgi:glutamyl-tRNA reductase
MMLTESLHTVGVSHKSSPLVVRERFAFPPGEVRDLLAAPGGERLLLVTCNRTELYGLEPGERLAERVLRAAGPDVDGSVLFALEGAEAARHLFSVAAGLDSMVVGEPQILGQVKRAMRTAREARALGPTLDALSRRALTVGRRVRRETELGKGMPSIPKVAVAVAKLVLGDLTGRSILVVGSGKLGGLTAHTLRRAGAGSVVVTNRTPDLAAQLAIQIGGRAEPLAALDRLLADTDIVISCTASQEPILTRERVEAALSNRASRPLVFVDIAVPRDVAADVRTLAGVKLFDLDDLRGLGSAVVPSDAIASAWAIVEAETRGFLAWQAGRAAVPTIRALQERANTILESELGRVPADHAEVMRAFGRRLVAKLLHHPMRRLRDGAAADGDAYLDVARDLFALESENGDRDSG